MIDGRKNSFFALVLLVLTKKHHLVTLKAENLNIEMVHTRRQWRHKNHLLLREMIMHPHMFLFFVDVVAIEAAVTHPEKGAKVQHLPRTKWSHCVQVFMHFTMRRAFVQKNTSSAGHTSHEFTSIRKNPRVKIGHEAITIGLMKCSMRRA